MKFIIPKIKISDIKAFLKKFRSLIFWLALGIFMSIVFGIIMRDYQTSFTIFMGFGIFLGMTLQFVKSTWLKGLAVFLCVVFALNIIWKPLVSSVQSSLNQKISRSFLVDDVRQLASILESTHPDPYTHGGGKIAFHRRMQHLIRTIPDEGLTKTEFYYFLCPFMAAVGDGHTSFWEPYNLNGQNPGGIPLYFQAVENFLYVSGVINPTDQHLIGAKLVSIENVSFKELLNRQKQLKGYDNEFQLMRNLGYDGSLWFRARMEQLLPEWEDDSIDVVLLKANGKEVEHSFLRNTKGPDQLITAETNVTLPSTEKSNYVYQFMDEEKKTALLLIENMYSYRESFEMELVVQKSLRTGLANYLYEKYNDAAPPGNEKDLVLGIPSATELCKKLVEEMKQNQSENLIIDLRRNQGGNAFISTIFLYFFYGKDALVSFSNEKSIFIKKYSPLFWKQYWGLDIDDINKNQPIELTKNDYDFSYYPEQGDNVSSEESIRIIEEEASTAATFWDEYKSEKYSGYYRPKNIFILCSPLTNSSGYAFMYDQWASGGKLVGIPSSQAGNTCGAWVGFKLRNSRLGGGISHLYITHFRDNSEMGRTFRPDFEMTYDNLNSYNFDPNAEILFTMQLINSQKN